MFAAGAVSGIVSRTSTAPLDRIKIILQVDGSKKSGVPRIPHGPGAMRGAISLIYKDGGMRGFWRGNGANILKVMPESATKFFMYDLTTQHLFKHKDRLSMTDRLTAGCIAGAVSQLLVCVSSWCFFSSPFCTSVDSTHPRAVPVTSHSRTENVERSIRVRFVRPTHQ